MSQMRIPLRQAGRAIQPNSHNLPITTSCGASAPRGWPARAGWLEPVQRKQAPGEGGRAAVRKLVREVVELAVHKLAQGAAELAVHKLAWAAARPLAGGGGRRPGRGGLRRR